MAWGTYGASNRAISAGSSLRDRAAHGIFEMLRLRRADDGRRDEGLLRNPGQCDLCFRYAACGRDGCDLLDDLAVALDR
jgi:hypothetical protein